MSRLHRCGGFLLSLAACRPGGPHAVPAPAALARAESVYAATLTLKDRLDILTWRGRLDSVPAFRARYLAARTELVRELAIDSLALADTVDRRALAVMRRAVAEALTEETESTDGPAAVDPARCVYDAQALADADSLQSRLYDCYGVATRDVVVDGERLDRLTVLGLLGVTDDGARRRRLFHGLDRVWRSVNGADDTASPWRELLRRRAREWGTGPTPFARRVSELGFIPDSVEHWLVRLLEAWRATLPDSQLEPWDLYYAMGAASRRLSPRIPRDSLLAVNRRFYRDLGADPVILGVHFDLEPRAGKDPVAFTTFGARPGFTRGAWQPGESWVFASYAVGGLDNLGELLHETGHAIHIAAIRTRPAFSDWPDADLFTEAIADLADGEAYDGRWQAHYLGDSAPPSENRRAAYFGVMMDACWSLFEARMQRDPALDPNIVWTELTSRYLRVVPHPELSWWAMRGQLIDVPGYLVNYALGAFIAADLRARIREAHGAFTLGDSTWYDFVRERIYRFGLERSSQRVMEEFLGRPVSAEALLSDLRRGLSPGTGGPAH
ncbi:MAG: hypothetical protein ACM368_06990 [Gemmatimonadota bacterium]